MMNLKSFSQNVINPKSIIEPSNIQISKPIAKLVVKDLIRYDGLTQEFTTLESILDETNSKLSVQDELNKNLTAQIDNFCRIVNEQATQVALSKELTAKLEKDLKKQKFKAKFFGGVSLVALVGVVVLAN